MVPAYKPKPQRETGKPAFLEEQLAKPSCLVTCNPFAVDDCEKPQKQHVNTHSMLEQDRNPRPKEDSLIALHAL